MMRKNQKSKLTSFFVILCILLPLFMGGCQAYQTFSDRAREDFRDWKDTDTDLTKRILMGPMEVKTFYDLPEKNALVAKAIMEKIPAKRFEIVSVGAGGVPMEVWQSLSPSNQKTDSIALATVARQYGLNAFVRYGFDDVRPTSKSSGFWWFRKVKYLSEAQFFVEIYDAETGTKIFDELFMFDQKLFGEDEYVELQDEQIVEIPNLDKHIRKLGNDMGESITKVLNKVYWKGYVTAVDGAVITFTGGTKSGITTGKKFGIYATRVSAQGKSGYYFRPGDRIAEVQVTSVSADKIEAKVLSGSGIQVGDTVHRTER